MPTAAQRKAIVGYLNEYCFQKVWNSVHSEYRSNFALTSVAARLQTTSFVFDNSVVGLPTTGAFMIYRFGKSLLQGAYELADSNWHTLVDISLTQNVKLSIYDTAGHLIPMCGAYAMTPKGSNVVFVAISKEAILASIPTGLSTDLYMTCYRNNNLSAGTWAVYSGRVVKIGDTDAAMNAALAAPSGTAFIVINGISYPSLSDAPTIKVGDYVDIGIDPSITAEYVIPVDNTDKGYFSTRYQDYRKILHCPKDLNPENYLLTHDGATIFIRDIRTKQAVYFHRLDPYSVRQITHNDLSVSLPTLLAFKNSMEALNIEIVVRMRAHPIHRTLMMESSWVSDLYLCDDATIIGHLWGRLDSTLTFWTAQALEQSGYVNLMFSDVDNVDPTKLDTYVNALGYYTVAAILSSNLYTGTYEGSDLYITKPFAQIGNAPTALVFVNGVKVHQSHITAIDYDDWHMGVSIASSVGVKNGDTIQIQLLDSGKPEPTYFVPSANTNTLTMSSNSGSVYVQTQEPGTSGYLRLGSVGWLYTPSGLKTYQINQNSDGTYTYTFAEALYGTPIIVTPEKSMWYQSIDLDDILKETKPLVFPLETQVADGVYVPLLGYGSVELFLNGRYLVRDVDYKLDPLYGATGGGIVFTDAVLACASYFTAGTTGNTLEVFVSSDQNPSRDVGYVVDNILPRTNAISFWFPYVSTAFIEGVLTTDLLDRAVYMQSPSGVDNGSLFELKPTYPSMVAELLSDYSPLVNERTISLVNTYLGRSAPAKPSTIALTTEHKIYSPYITAIATDMVAGAFTITDDINQKTFLSQFSAYSYLRDRDPTVSSADTRIDRNYLSVAASYSQFPTMTAKQTQLLQKLIGLELITSKATLGVTLV